MNSDSPSPPPIPSDLSYVAKGSYGCVLRPALPNYSTDAKSWIQYPKHVTKLFFDKNNMKKAYKNSKKIYNLLGHNKGHKTYKYKHKYRSSNIPNNIRTRCSKIRKNVSLHPLHMRNLGNDFFGIEYGKKYMKYRSIYVGIILDQMLKVMKQIQILVSNGLIHGDVRETNITIHPESGVITLIDFDFLNSVEKYFETTKLGFYCHPLETLLYKDCKEFLNASQPEVDALLDSHKLDIELTKYAKHHSAFRFAEPRFLNRNASKAELKAALKDSIFYFTTQFDVDESSAVLKKELRNALLPSYDGYGFAFTMLDFIGFVYPSTTIRVQDPRFDTGLKSRINDKGDPYTDAEITHIRTALHRLVFEVFEPMAELRFQRRMDIHTAVERAEAIIDSFHDYMHDGEGS
jgi:serine/threonine protein kinase